VVAESGLGLVVPNGEMDGMAARILETARATWDREAAVKYILENHTWEARMRVYAQLLRRQFPGSLASDERDAIRAE
jgi:hypothetical protein